MEKALWASGVSDGLVRQIDFSDICRRLLLSIISNHYNFIQMDDSTPRVTGIGGIFFKADNPDKISSWYGRNLGLVIDEYGKFVHILDPENNKIELWEPVDQVFTDMGMEATK